MAESVSTYVAMLKEYYTTFVIANMVFRNAPWLAMIPKNTDIEGESWDVPLIYGDPQAGSASFTAAQGNKGNVSSAKFQVTTKDEYSFAAVTRKVIKASRTNKGAFLPAMRPNVDGAINTVKRSLGIQAYRDGSGAKGRIQAINDAGSNGIITFGNTTDGVIRHETVNWQKGEKFQLSDTKSGGSLRNSGNTATILAVNRGAGTVTISGKLSAAIAAGAANDYMYRQGDYDSVIEGLDGWIPATAPAVGGGDSHYGVDRSADPDMLAGIRVTGTGMNVLDALINGQSEISTIGDGMPDHVFLHPSQFRALLKEVGAKVELDTYRVNQVLSFQGLTVQGDAGEMRIIPDRYCLADAAFPLQLDTWEMGSMGALPEIFDADTDQEMLREGSSDGYEIRVGGYGNIACHAPGYNGRISLDLQSAASA